MEYIKINSFEFGIEFNSLLQNIKIITFVRNLYFKDYTDIEFYSLLKEKGINKILKKNQIIKIKGAGKEFKL
jgi:hypothetical protein